jgi:hypothetical protein
MLAVLGVMHDDSNDEAQATADHYFHSEVLTKYTWESLTTCLVKLLFPAFASLPKTLLSSSPSVAQLAILRVEHTTLIR